MNLNIVVLAGGLSPERNVSLTSGSLIASALRRKGHKVLLLDVYLGIDIEDKDNILSLFTSEAGEEFSVSENVPDLEALKAEKGSEELIGRNVLEICSVADTVFLALHGAMGENGQLQATLDNFGISYSGSGYIGSLLAMDKDISKRMLRASGVLTPDWIYEKSDEITPEEIIEKIGLPTWSLPPCCRCGSRPSLPLCSCRCTTSTAS